MELQKAYFNVTENEVRLSMPLQKIDKQARTVSGFASLDNIDTHGDIVTHEANKKAFGKFRGNLRLMHQPIPAGRLLSFREDEHYDPETKKFYNGIYVTAYVSKGAQNIWEMVLDGTLTGFSIGGSIKETESKFVKSEDGTGRTVRLVKDYDLTELSLVDSPANQLANLVSIQKLADGQVEVTGAVADTKIENVFYCKGNDQHESDRIVPSTSETLECSVCENDMENAGWYESVSDEERADKVASVINKFLAPESEGGVHTTNMTIKKVADEAEVETVAVNNAQGTTTDENGEVTAGPSEAVDVEEVEKTDEAAEVDEVEQPTDFAKMLDGVRDDLKEAVEKSATANAEQIASLEARLNEVNESFTAKFAEIEAKNAEITEKFNGLNADIEKMAGKVETVASETAVKKSNDLGGSEDGKLEKSASSKQSFWGRAFSVDSDLT